jgi:regulator of protease activity HflC (stomatin/prohibitin superfamily)
MSPGAWVAVAAAAIGVVLLFKWIKILREYERGVIFRLGRVRAKPKGPGLVIVLWPVDHMVRVSLRTMVHAIPSQDVITRDNVSIAVNAVLYFRVVQPNDAVIQVDEYFAATAQLAQTTLRSVLGMVELDELLSERDKINQRLREIIDSHTGPWGIKVAMVEVKQVDLPKTMQRMIARQAEAERERRAKIIHAEGEFAAAERLAAAAQVIQRQPAAIQLRYLQTLVELSEERTSTIVFPIPVDIIQAFLGSRQAGAAATEEAEESSRPTPH